MVDKESDVVVVNTSKVMCDGGGGALGHPRVWYRIPVESGSVDCGYCDRIFVLEGSHAHMRLSSGKADR